MKNVEKMENPNLILCGDFNAVQDEKLDYHNYKSVNNKKAQAKILEIKSSYNLVDPFREIHPLIRRYTWRRKWPLKQARLDFFLLSEDILASVNKCSIEASYRSAHSVVILEIDFLEFKKGKPFWKHIDSLLQDIENLRKENHRGNITTRFFRI